MDDSANKGKNQSNTQQQSNNRQEEKQDSEKVMNFNVTELSDAQKIKQDAFFSQFVNFSPSKKPNFLSKDYEIRLNKNVQFLSSLFQSMHRFYKDQYQNAEKIKNKILLRLEDPDYSMNHLSIISNFFQSYSAFQNFCNSAQIILSNQNYPNPPYQIFERFILLNILNTHRNLTLKNLLVKFKRFSMIRRKEILTIAVDRFFFGIRREDKSIPILTLSKERTFNELSRLSRHLGINYDLEAYDGQQFLYACETILSEYRRLTFSFNIVSENQPRPLNLIDRINSSLMTTFSKDDLVVEAFNNIITPNSNYTNKLIDNLHISRFPKELIVSWTTLRFCRNRQLLSEIEKSTTKLFECKKDIYDVCRIELKDEQRTFCDKYISFIIDLILTFSTAVFAASGKKADLDPLLEIMLDKFVLYTNAKVKILSLFTEIAKHSAPEKVVELTQMIIDKRPNLIFQHLSFFEHFDTQIETLEMIAKCLLIVLNLHFLNERQITSFYGAFFEPFQFGTFYSNQGDGQFNTSKFEVYLTIEKVLNFFYYAPKIIEEICASMSIKGIDYSIYIEYGIWSQLLNEIDQYPEVSIFGTDFYSIRFNLPLSKDVESLLNCQLLNDPLFLKNFIAQNNQPKFAQNLTSFCLLALKLRSLIYKTNLYLSLYFQQYQDSNSTCVSNKNIEFIGKSFNFTNYEEIQKLCLNGDLSEIIEIVNCQKRYNVTLMIAVQHNNFRSDNELISILFEIAKPDSVFNYTKSETKNEEDTKFYKNAAQRFFVGFDTYYNQDFSSIFCDVSKVTDFSDPKNLIDQLKKYMSRIELATITNYERIFLHDFQQIELFSLDRQFYRPNEEAIVDYFAIPSISQCLLLECENDQFDSILSLIVNRLQLISFIRFYLFFKTLRKDPYIMLYTRKITWESSFLSKLNSTALKTVNEAIKVLKAECVYEIGRFQLAILLLLQKLFTVSKKDSEKLNAVTVDDVRNFWKIVNQEYDPKLNDGFKPYFNSVSIGRYAPVFLSQFNFTFSESLKNEILGQIGIIDKKNLQSFTFKDPQNSELELSEYVDCSVTNELLKFVLLRLQTNCSYSDLNVLSLVDITRYDYEENLHVYSNFFVVPGKPRLPKQIENGLLKQPITEAVGKAQRKQNEERYDRLSEKLKVFDSINSLLKPDIYIKKTKVGEKKLKPYNPSPENADLQFNQEMRFANSKIVSMMIQAINHSIISDKPVIFNTNSQIDLKFDPNVLATELSPLSYYLINFLDESQKQLLKTWLSYNEIIKEITCSYDTGDVLIKLFKRRFNIDLNFQLTSKYFNDFITLAKLREIEKTTNKEQEIFQQQMRKKIHDEYESQLDELSKENQELRKQYRAIHDKLFGLTDNIIKKQENKIPENEKILQPNNEAAQKSLDISKKEGFTLEVDDDLRNEVFSSSSEIVEEKKEEEDETEAFPTFNFAAVSRDDSVVKFPTFQPPRMALNNQVRRNTMIRPGARALLLARQNIEKEKEKEKPPPPKTPLDNIKDQIEKSKQKYKVIESELPDLKKTILKLRITRCLFRIAVSKNFKKKQSTLSREKKEASSLLWANKKIFEEDFRIMQENKDDRCNRLLHAELECENLKKEIEEQKKVTTKLAHWKELNLKQTDQILKQIEAYEKGPNIDVNKLLKKLDQKRAELDALYINEETFETEKYYKITQPLEEISRVRRFVQSEKYNYMKMQATMSQNHENEHEEDSLDEDKINEIIDQNLRLKMDNKRLKDQISRLEQKDDQIVPPIQLDQSQKTFELPQLPTSRRLRMTSVSARGPRTTVKPRTLYSNYGYRTIKRPTT